MGALRGVGPSVGGAIRVASQAADQVGCGIAISKRRVREGCVLLSTTRASAGQVPNSLLALTLLAIVLLRDAHGDFPSVACDSRFSSAVDHSLRRGLTMPNYLLALTLLAIVLLRDAHGDLPSVACDSRFSSAVDHSLRRGLTM